MVLMNTDYLVKIQISFGDRLVHVSLVTLCKLRVKKKRAAQ